MTVSYLQLFYYSMIKEQIKSGSIEAGLQRGGISLQQEL
jgi:hypothetical protein